MDAILSGLNSFAVILPVIAAVAGAFFVYAVGFKPAEEPKFKKSSGSSDITKKQKRIEKAQKASLSPDRATNASPVKKTKPVKDEEVTKKTPVKEVAKKDVPTEAVAAPAKKEKKVAKAAPVVAKAAKKQPKIAEKVAKETKPTGGNDDGWWTVPTKSEKKKVRDVTAVSASVEKSPEKTNTKLLKDQANNKVKKEAGGAAVAIKPATASVAPAVVYAAPVERAPTIPIIPTPITASTTGFEYVVAALNVDKKTADIIEKIEEAIIDEVVAPVKSKPATAPRIINDNKRSTKASLDNALSAEKVDQIKAVESNVAFDELGDAWTEAKAPKKKVRRD